MLSATEVLNSLEELCICIYTPGQKYKTTLKNQHKDFVYSF